jgi:hypothetical protein
MPLLRRAMSEACKTGATLSVYRGSDAHPARQGQGITPAIANGICRALTPQRNAQILMPFFWINWPKYSWSRFMACSNAGASR